MFAFTSCPQVVSNQRLFPKQRGTILAASGSNSTPELHKCNHFFFHLSRYKQPIDQAWRPGKLFLLFWVQLGPSERTFLDLSMHLIGKLEPWSFLCFWIEKFSRLWLTVMLSYGDFSFVSTPHPSFDFSALLMTPFLRNCLNKEISSKMGSKARAWWRTKGRVVWTGGGGLISSWYLPGVELTASDNGLGGGGFNSYC